jgi:KDO2-lipid IV(A) lauroyltransferase
MINKNVIRKALYIILKATSPLALILPIGWVVPAGSFLGTIAYLILNKERKKAIENLSTAFSREMTILEIKRLCRESFQNLGINLIELLRFPKLNRENIDEFVTIIGRDRIDTALKNGKGAIMLTAHLGNWELMAAYVALKDYPTNVVARPIYYEGYNETLVRLRESKGIKVIYRDDVKLMLQSLKNNELLGILADQDTVKVDGLFVKFFDELAYTPTGPVALAMKTGAPLIPCFIIRENGRHKIFVEEPLPVMTTGDKDKDLLINTEMYSKTIERWVRKYPSQWVWMHQRWKTRPK